MRDEAFRPDCRVGFSCLGKYDVCFLLFFCNYVFTNIANNNIICIKKSLKNIFINMKERLALRLRGALSYAFCSYVGLVLFQVHVHLREREVYTFLR